jgi:hypothetical protein
MEQLNSIVQENVSSSELVASSAAELLGQAEQLIDIVNYFKSDSSKYENIQDDTLHEIKANEIFDEVPMISANKEYISENSFEEKPVVKVQKKYGFDLNLSDNEFPLDEFEKF